MDDVVIVGVGMTRFTKTPDRTVEDLGQEAVSAALADAGMERSEIEAAWCGTLYSHPGIGQRVLKDIGMTGIPIVNVENACASGSTALHSAYAAVKAGMCDIALAIGVETLSRSSGPITKDPKSDYMWGSGFMNPVYYALLAQQHMHRYGTTREQMALVSVKSHNNAMHNPYAHFHKPVSVEEVLNSKLIADPITLFQACPTTDGAAAAIVCNARVARRHTRDPIRIAASTLTSGKLKTRSDATEEMVPRAVKRAYENAGIGPEDIDVAEVHDAFAPAEIMAYEELGLCGEGDGGAYAQHGMPEIAGKGVPVNTGGGLLSRGHPLGATGIAQIAELTWQLRGDAGPRQVDRAKTAVAHNMGGTTFQLEADACMITVLQT
jgi:benzoylsuccinyl-CoA thiolase BbsB subunit